MSRTKLSEAIFFIVIVFIKFVCAHVSEGLS